LYRTFSTPQGVFYGNADLKPERLTGGEAGFDVTLPSVRAQVTYYRNDIEDLITTRNLTFSELPSGFFFGSRGINAGRARAQGAESEVDWSVSERIQAVFAYAYADSTIRDNPLDPASVGNQLGGVPRQTASASLAYTDKPGLSLATRLRWLEKSYADNDQTLPVDGHFVVDLSVAYSFQKHFEPYLQIENLFDRHYVADNSGFSAPQLGTPLTVFVGIRARFE
jgi:outer membrane receptor protein involved in Fe transport